MSANELNETKYDAMVENASPRVKISSTVFKDFIGDVYDVVNQHAGEIDGKTNKIAVYNGSNPIDPNTTTDAYIITSHANAPISGIFWHIHTSFFNNTSDNRAQIAIRYSTSDAIYVRRNNSGTWSSWVEVWTATNNPASLSSAPYQKFASGIIIPGGVVTSVPSGGDVNVTFPIAFPTACRAVVITVENSPTSAAASASTITTTGFIARHADSTTRNLRYMAFGY